MRNNSLFLVMSAVLFWATLPVSAQTTSSVNLDLKSRYVLKDIGVVASNEPVLQVSNLWTSGKFTFGPWVSLGNAQFGKELDLLAFYNTNAGPFKVQLAFQYFFLNGKGGMLNTRNHLMQPYADVGLPLAIGKSSVTPFLRVAQQISLGNFPTQTLVQPGVRARLVLSDDLAITGETMRTSIIDERVVWRYEFVASQRVAKNLSVRVRYEGASNAGDAVSLGLSASF
jgi:hypothetical protein